MTNMRDSQKISSMKLLKNVDSSMKLSSEVNMVNVIQLQKNGMELSETL